MLFDSVDLGATMVIEWDIKLSLNYSLIVTVSMSLASEEVDECTNQYDHV